MPQDDEDDAELPQVAVMAIGASLYEGGKAQFEAGITPRVQALYDRIMTMVLPKKGREPFNPDESYALVHMMAASALMPLHCHTCRAIFMARMAATTLHHVEAQIAASNAAHNVHSEDASHATH